MPLSPERFASWRKRAPRQASEIRNLIEDSTSQTQEGMHLVEKASALINGMVDNVEEMDVIITRDWAGQP
ncbi:Methyl-accepting chemotaxis protein II [Salmonella enterica subsp. enterica]|uniref:Methyl-accepting chemotaxis protein II n=1 Tax=Salmonella enterica I TaxID=59201 RepID=A0A447TV31_SALET|nr:Methyl-accepting chemotaxis protein II [Salmonella enterica subsp. enterica]